LTPIGETVASFGEAITIPSRMGGPVWVRIDIRPSLWGNIVAMLYRPPRIALILSASKGEEHSSRLVPVEARAGFLLSPVVADRQFFFALASTIGSRIWRTSKWPHPALPMKAQEKPHTITGHRPCERVSIVWIFNGRIWIKHIKASETFIMPRRPCFRSGECRRREIVYRRAARPMALPGKVGGKTADSAAR
jgi:hypothetical protein